jgi:tetratricopeptide (TPR) repeat protein
MRGLIAASLYGDVAPGEKQVLDGHLASCAACRAELESLQRLTLAITPSLAPALDRDLTPVLRYRVREGKTVSPHAFRPWRFVFSFSSVAALFVITSYVIIPQFARPGAPVSAPIASPAVVDASVAPEDPPVQCALTEADRLAAYHDYANAYRTLKQVVEEHPEAPRAAEAQLKRAEIAFSNLKWYPEAYEDYELLAERYPAHFASSSDSIRRRDLLAESRERDYASLYALDAARRGGDEQFAKLEKVIGRYPGTFVASAAANDMAVLIGGGAGIGEGSEHLNAMRTAFNRCADVVAKRQLDLEVGRIYQREIDDPDKARECYKHVLESGDAVLAQLAKRSLAELGSVSR